MELDELVLDVFAQTLELGGIDADADFFGLGGDSLSSMIVVSELQERLGLNLNPTAPFAYPTARLLAEAIRSGEVVEPDVVAVLDRPTDHVPLSPIQEGQLRIAPYVASRGFLSWVYQLNGRLNADALALALDDVVREREILRTRFGSSGSGARYQYVVPFAPGTLRVVDLSDQPGLDRAAAKVAAISAARNAAEAEYQSLSPLDDPEFRATLYYVAPKTHVFSVFVSEALVDGESGNLIATEISRRYAVHAGEPSPAVVDLPGEVSFLDYLRDNPPHPATVARAYAHWEAQLAAAPPAYGWPMSARSEVATCAFDLPAEEWDAVASAAQALRTTPYVLVLAAYEVALARVADARHLLLTTVVSDRSDHATERMLGSFHSVVRVDSVVDVGADRISDVVARTAAGVRQAITHCVVPAPLADTGPVPPMSGVHFYMFESHEGPAYAGVRRRRFRLHSSSREALRLNCTRGADGSRSFFFASMTAAQPMLRELSLMLHATLTAAATTPDLPVAHVDPATVGDTFPDLVRTN